MSNILLTGSTGFIGSNLLQELSKENTIYILLRYPFKKLNLVKKNIIKIKYKNYNNLDFKLKKLRIDTVIHCATHYVKEHKRNDIKKFAESNILFGNIILENLEKMKVKKFINFSTVWADNYKIDGYVNLYSLYKKSFSLITQYYIKKFTQIKFYDLLISDTFGFGDKRPKIINILKKNYKKNKITKILSENLYLNLLNIEDISRAINIILNKKITPNKYVIKNSKEIKVSDIIALFNKKNKKKLRVKWSSKKLIKSKIINYKKLTGWKPKKSNIDNIISIIKN